MAYNTSESGSLDQLQTPEQVELLDAVDKLRSQGLGHYNISLPQLIVCGDQSSGKSSLLEGLTRLRFPAKGGLCTNFATELVLRRQGAVEFTCTIVPGKDRSPAERRELLNFSKSFSSRQEFSFPSLISEANAKMAIGGKSRRGPFFEDILRIRYCGPDVPSLTLVDLPGIISSDMEDGDGVQKVLQLIEGYMRDEKSIILAVVAANYDARIQKIFQYIKEFDPDRSRTLGIITKPDQCHTMSAAANDDSEGAKEGIMNVATNKYCPLKLRWHVVKNRGPDEQDLTDDERDEAERLFFERGAWASLPRTDVGISALRARLSRVLLEHIVQELPSLITAIQVAITVTEDQVKLLGSSRETVKQQRDYLIERAEKFQILTHNALRGIYSDPFFKPLSTGDSTPTRLRTEIQNLNIAFACTMYRKGHFWDISDDAHLPPRQALSSQAAMEYDIHFDDPCHIERTDFLQEYIANAVRQSRPAGLPSLVNPHVIGEVFRRQSERWGDIAEHHLEQVFRAVKAYMERGLGSLMDARTRKLLMFEQIEDSLDQRWKDVRAKLDELLIPYTEQDPVTYDPTFIYEIEEIRSKRYAFQQQQKSTFAQVSSGQLLTETLDDFTNSEILDLMQTYYKKAISVFINNVAVLAIENCLIAKLESIFSPVLIAGMDEEKLSAIAAESADMREHRASLKQKLHDLKYGKRVLHIHSCDTRPDSTSVLRQSKRADSSVRVDWLSPDTRTPIKAHSRTTSKGSQMSSRNPSRSEPQIDDLTSSLTSLSVTPPPSEPLSRQYSAARNRSVTPTPPIRGSTRRRPGWPPKFATVESDCDSDEPMFSPVQSSAMLQEVVS